MGNSLVRLISRPATTAYVRGYEYYILSEKRAVEAIQGLKNTLKKKNPKEAYLYEFFPVAYMLDYAAYYNKPKIMRLLWKANSDWATGDYTIPLCIAISRSASAVCKEIINAGLTIAHVDWALEVARERENTYVARALDKCYRANLSLALTKIISPNLIEAAFLEIFLYLCRTREA